MKKRWLSLLLISAMLVASSCSQGTGTANSTADTDSTASEGSASEQGGSGEEEPVTFEWFIDASVLPQGWSMDQPVFQAITEATGCTPNITIPAADASTKLNLMISGGQLPDLMSITDMTLISDMISGGLIWDMGEFAETYMPEDSDFLDNFPEDVKEAISKRDGGWYCFPSHIVSEDSTEIWGYPDSLAEYYESLRYDNQFSVYFLNEFLEELDVDVKSIDTEEKLFDYLELVKSSNLKNESGADVYPLVIPPIDLSNMQAVNNMFGALPFDENGTYRSVYYDPNYRHGIEFLNQCYQRGYLDESLFTIDSATQVSLCNSSRAAVYIGGVLAMGAHNESRWSTPGAVLPSNGASPSMGVSSAVAKGWIQTVVKKDGEHEEAVGRFLDYMASAEGMLVHMYGMEGVDYEWDDDGLLHRTEVGSSKVEDGVTGVFGFFAFHNTSFQRSVEYVDLSAVTDNRTALGMSDLTFKYDSSLLETPTNYVEPGSDYEFIYNEVTTYVESNIAKIILAPDDATFNSMFDDFLAKLDELRLPEYDAYIDIQVQKNCEEAGARLTDGLE